MKLTDTLLHFTEKLVHYDMIGYYFNMLDYIDNSKLIKRGFANLACVFFSPANSD